MRWVKPMTKTPLRSPLIKSYRHVYGGMSVKYSTHRQSTILVDYCILGMFVKIMILLITDGGYYGAVRIWQSQSICVGRKRQRNTPMNIFPPIRYHETRIYSLYSQHFYALKHSVTNGKPLPTYSNASVVFTSQPNLVARSHDTLTRFSPR